MFNLTYAHRSGAGAHEQKQFEEGRRAFRKRVLPALRLMLLVVAAPCLGYEFWKPSPIHFVAGMLFGGCAVCYLWARDEVPEHVRRHGAGAEGERATAKAIKPLLKEGWRVVHNVETKRGNRDHILVGPAGLFLLDSKHLGGHVTIDGDVVCVERVDHPEDSYRAERMAGALRRDAARLHDELADKGAGTAWVQAVVVIWSPFEAAAVAGDRIHFVHGPRLLSWLRDQPHRCDQQRIDALATLVE